MNFCTLGPIKMVSECGKDNDEVDNRLLGSVIPLLLEDECVFKHSDETLSRVMLRHV